MFTLRDRRTGELFDRWSDFGDKRRRLMEQSWAGVFRNHLLVELPVDFRLTIFAVTLMNAWADHRRIYTLSSGSCFCSSCTI